MKIRVNLWLTVFLFLMMLIAGLASSSVGYFMGREALKVVTQPEISTEGGNRDQKPKGGEHKGLKIVKEQDILVKIYSLVNAKR